MYSLLSTAAPQTAQQTSLAGTQPPGERNDLSFTPYCTTIYYLNLHAIFLLALIHRPTKKPHGWGGWNEDGYEYIETDIPTSSPTFAETEASSSQFRDGFKKGEERAEAIWQENSSDCGYIFSFQDDADKE
jgi:hypothetical protein